MIPVDPVSAAAAVGSIVSAAASVSREVREWRSHKRDKLEVAVDRSGYHVQPLRHDEGALMTPRLTMPAYVTPATLVGKFCPADGVAARRLADSDEALVLVAPCGNDQRFDSVLFTCALNDSFVLELNAGAYDVIALVVDELRNEVLGTAGMGALQIPWSTYSELTLSMAASEELYISDELVGQLGDTVAELILPDGVRLPLSWSTLIGSAADVTLSLPDHRVGPHHASIQFNNGYYYAHDLGSFNGTLVNGQFIRSCLLNHGDMITIVDWNLEFRFR